MVQCTLIQNCWEVNTLWWALKFSNRTKVDWSGLSRTQRLGSLSEFDGRNTSLQRSSAPTGCASQNVSPSNWQFWHIDLSTAPLRPTYSHVSPAFPTLHPDDGCGLLPHIVWTFHRFVSLQSAGGRFRFRVPPPGTTCLSTSHLRRHSRFCFPVPTKTLSYDSSVTITIYHYCLDTRCPCNN